MSKQQMTLIGAGTIATLLLIFTLAFGGLAPLASGGDAEGNGIFSSVVSSFGEEEDDDEDEMEEDEMEENEMDDDDDEEEDDD
ncbi:MAG: hypothetical protein AAF614_27945 [Chloroflexota bacterium]